MGSGNNRRKSSAGRRVLSPSVTSWCIYDWANSAFGTLITTFIFAPYFIMSVAPTPTEGTVLWGHASSFAAILMALASPVLGAIADKTGRRKPWLITCTALCVVLTASLYFVQPRAEHVMLALALFVPAAVFSELAFVFYNAMLPTIVPRVFFGRVSGIGIAVGYVGGIAALAFALFGLVREDAIFGALDQGSFEHIRATALLVAAWYAIFSVPLLIFTRDGPRSGVTLQGAVREGLAALKTTFSQLGRYSDILRFLLAYLFYSNGIVTLFAFGGVFAAGVFGMTMEQVVAFAIGLNVMAGIGAAGFGWLDDRIGSKPTIMIVLVGLLAVGTTLVATTSLVVVWTIGLGLGLFIGGGQSASRSLMAKLTPARMETEMFGLYALSGRATAFAGPLIVALVTDAMDNQRAGMAAILGFFLVGVILMSFVREPARYRNQHHDSA